MIIAKSVKSATGIPIWEFKPETSGEITTISLIVSGLCMEKRAIYCDAECHEPLVREIVSEPVSPG